MRTMFINYFHGGILKAPYPFALVLSLQHEVCSTQRIMRPIKSHLLTSSRRIQIRSPLLIGRQIGIMLFGGNTNLSGPRIAKRTTPFKARFISWTGVGAR
jgi:hypothetical protein